jgi:hypothetical protein
MIGAVSGRRVRDKRGGCCINSEGECNIDQAGAAAERLAEERADG